MNQSEGRDRRREIVDVRWYGEQVQVKDELSHVALVGQQVYISVAVLHEPGPARGLSYFNFPAFGLYAIQCVLAFCDTYRKWRQDPLYRKYACFEQTAWILAATNIIIVGVRG